MNRGNKDACSFAAARILAVLAEMPEAKRLDALTLACAAYCQTGGRLKPEASRRDTALPLESGTP